jgi:uncharacterized peroxidase-related enzyme
MSRLQPLELDTAPEPQRSQLAAVKQKLGGVPNLLRTFATSPNVLEAYLGFSGALGKTDLDGALVESVALTVAGVNGCEYCAAAHTAIGKGQGLGADAAVEALAGRSADPSTQVALDFAREVLETRGHVADATLDRLRGQGFTEGQIAELTALVALNVFTNFFNHVAGTEIDFPRVALPTGA